MKKNIFLYLIFVILFSNCALYSQSNKDKKENQYLSTEAFSELDVLSKYYKKALTGKGDKTDLESLSNAKTDYAKIFDKSSGLLPIDGFVNAENYYLGPNDILEVTISSATPITIPVTISPEGSIVINYVGEINLKNLTLDKAKEKIINEIKKKFKSNDISVILKSPRVFNVSVVGNVNFPGTFTVSAFDRVDRIVALAVKEKEVQQINKTIEMEKLPYFRDEVVENRFDYSLRNIKIFRKNGDTINVDLIKYFAIGDNSSNPYLRDGDIILIPKEDIEGNFIGIFGAVKQPGKFEYCKGDKLSTAIKIAQGTIENSDLSNIELTRISEDWSTFTVSKIDYNDIITNKSHDIELKPGDRIFVRPLKSIKPTKEVTIKGEVLKPGKYPIVKGVTKLSEVIKSAGGFTENASLAEARIIRKIISDDELRKNPDYERLETMRLGKLDRTDIEYFTVEEAIKRGYVVTDFKKLFLKNEKNYDITLEGDEIIYIPTNYNSVYVYGQVNNPGYIRIENGKDYKYYIEKAGGLSEGAIKGDIAIIKAGTKEWKEPSDTQIESGDIIWIPKKTYRDFSGWWEIAKDITSFIISTSTLVLLIIQIKK